MAGHVDFGEYDMPPGQRGDAPGPLPLCSITIEPEDLDRFVMMPDQRPRRVAGSTPTRSEAGFL
jgi:hypothetical protein